jgi:hypothetical protein
MSIYLRGNIWHIDLARRGRRCRASLNTRDRDEAERRAAVIEAAVPARRDSASEWAFTDKWVKERVWAMQQRSKRLEGPCMSRDDLRALAARSGGRCELTGVPFSDHRPLGCKRAPFAPSVDRIDPRRGYLMENCRLVCFAVNVALNQWGEETMRRFALGLIAKEGHVFSYSNAATA